MPAKRNIRRILLLHLEHGFIKRLSERDQVMLKIWFDDRFHGRPECTRKAGDSYKAVSTIDMNDALAAYDGHVRNKATAVTSSALELLYVRNRDGLVAERPGEVERLQSTLTALLVMLEQADVNT